MGRFFTWLLTTIGTAVLRAWAYVLRDEAGKFYARLRPAFIEGVKRASIITADDIPDFWTRRRAQASIVIEHLRSVMKAAGENIDDVAQRFIYAGIEAAVAEVKGGWVK